MDLSHLKHQDLTTWRLMRAGSVGCLVAAGIVLLGTLVTNAHANEAAMSTLRSFLVSLTPG